VDLAAVRIVLLLAVFPIKPLWGLNPTVQRLRPTVELVVCRQVAVLVAAVVAAALQKLVVRESATEVRLQAVELVEKAAKELPMQREQVLQSCTALAEVARDTGKMARAEQTAVAVAAPTPVEAQVLTALTKLVEEAVPVGAAE
jgi:hypothetical protein